MDRHEENLIDRQIDREILRWVCQKVLSFTPERKSIAEHFYFGNTLPLLIKLEKSKLVFLALQEMAVCCYNKNVQQWHFFLEKNLEPFWKNLLHTYIHTYTS